MNKRNILIPALAVLMLAAVIPAFRGVDYGHHWDEPRLLNSASASIQTGILLPRWYSYPSVSYDLMMLCAIPEMGIVTLDEFKQRSRDNTARIAAIKSRMQDYVSSMDFKLLSRKVFIIVSYLAVFWVGLLVYRWKGSVPEALIAAGILAGSWELNYHSRWIAPDCLLMQFGAMSTMFLVASFRNGPRAAHWLRLAAVSAGLACGAKYTGGIFLLPVLLSLFLQKEGVALSVNRKMIIMSFCGIMALFVLAFIASTPGAILEPVRFIRHVSWEISHYSNGHYGHSIDAGFEHAYSLFVYLSSVSLSSHSILALILFGFSIIGACSAYKDSRKEAAILLVVPIAYFIYMSSQKVMIVRNYLLLLPFMAIMASRGVAYTHGILSRRMPGYAGAIYVIAAVVFCINVIDLVSASGTVRDRHGRDLVKETRDHLTYHAEQAYMLSPEVKNLLSVPADEFLKPDAAKTNYLFMASGWGAGLANNKGRYQIVSGAREVNFDYYPDWAGNPKVISMDYKNAVQCGIISGGNTNE